jgi:copper chaperone CopZ
VLVILSVPYFFGETIMNTWITRRLLMLLTVFAWAAHFVGQARADEPALTQVTVEGMHCGGCALKLGRLFEAVPGVKSAKVDFATGLAVVTPTADKAPSPKALWETVEKAGYKPTKLVGPAGTFESKPSS